MIGNVIRSTKIILVNHQLIKNCVRIRLDASTDIQLQSNNVDQDQQSTNTVD